MEIVATYGLPFHLKPHGQYLSERYGLFVMLVLGESVVSLVITKSFQINVDYYVVIVSGFAIVYALQLNFFDTLPKASDQERILHSTYRKHVISLLNLLLAFSLLCVGVGTSCAFLKVPMTNGRDHSAIVFRHINRKTNTPQG